MALIKEKMTQFGIPASYWKVSMVSIDRNMKEAAFSLNLYITKDAKNFIESFTISSLMGKEDKTLYEEYFENKDGKFTDIYNICYEYAKNHEEFFKDAISDNTDI
ncbi:hypothetical protein [Clostridium sp.]|uniref:hypothetical protein n=1 Tax=Clostridium sp. TaxID=1506 RepID=UPI003217F715